MAKDAASDASQSKVDMMPDWLLVVILAAPFVSLFVWAWWYLDVWGSTKPKSSEDSAS